MVRRRRAQDRPRHRRVVLCGLHERRPKMKRKHEQYRPPEYRAWDSMKQRCYNPRNISYPRYGAVGVRVCKRWLRSFSAFMADMGRRPTSRHSLDRHPNNAGNYTPQNCRWATPRQQAANTLANRLLTYQGRTRHMSAWARDVGLKVGTLHKRLKSGWTVDEALSIPIIGTHDCWAGH